MYTVMITGGLGSGKSTVRKLFCEHGAISIDLDEIAKSLLNEDEQMISELAEEFGSAILDDDGSVITGKLAERAFASPEATRAMNAITFPRITERAMEYILNIHCTPRTDAEVLVIEVPLLTEVPEFAKLADEVIAVNASEDVRLMRAIERGMNPADALARIDAQPSDTERDALADTICDNAGSPEELAAWVDQWFEEHHFDGSHTTCSVPEVSSATEGE